jgi:hypothetical protein
MYCCLDVISVENIILAINGFLCVSLTLSRVGELSLQHSSKYNKRIIALITLTDVKPKTNNRLFARLCSLMRRNKYRNIFSAGVTCRGSNPS